MSVMSPIQPVTLQSLTPTLGEHLAIRYCAPLSFYMVLRAAGYLDKELMPDAFCAELDRGALTTQADDWSRPALTRLLREKYHVPVVSWWLNGQADFERMKKSGYVESEAEIKFFEEVIQGKTLKQLVQAGYPVIVTMKPGFGSEENSNIHAVVIAKWEDQTVTVVDPDARNPKSQFNEDYVQQYLSTEGAGSIVLPPSL